jgi:hypothetical protein
MCLIRPRPDSILPQRNSVMQQEFAGLKDVAVTFALFVSLLLLTYLPVSFQARIEGFYITPLDHVRTCICAHRDHRGEPILAHLPIRSTEQVVDHSSETFRQNARLIVLNLNICAGRTPRDYVTL